MRQGGFFQIDNSVIDLLPTIKPTGLAVYAYLCKLANTDGQCFPSQKTIGDAVGIQPRQVRNVLATLARVGLITTAETLKRDQRLNVYTVLTGEKNRQLIANNRQSVANNRQLIAPIDNEYRQLITKNSGNELPNNNTHVNKTQEEGERASAPPPPPLDPYLAAERLYHAEFADALFDFHGGTPQGKLQVEYIERLADWGKRGIVPTVAQFEAAVAEACAYWRREQKSGRCTASGPVLKALTDLVNPPLPPVSTAPVYVPPPPPTPEERSAQIAAKKAEIARMHAEFQARQQGVAA